ncbi:Mito carr domain containing protein [Asbolus verrucosus]|uniref:Mito carr domain containing protein n=1 Tax=Asbolus verrucosus TaxID=1661398 RepID=A0A482W1S8_ASBVE|nr:Mito carr domain containing protein [Asbolus verrucosus]
MDFLIGGLAAMGATIFSNPLDVLKTRMQLQGELKAPGQHAIHYRHSLHAAYVIVKTEGIFALQKGLTAALIMHGLRNSIKLGSYQCLANRGYTCNDEGKTIFHKSLLAGSFSGAAGAFCGSPFLKPLKKLLWDINTDIQVLYKLSKQFITSMGQIQGLWRGANANILRTIVGTSVQLTSFAKTKDVLKNHETFCHSTVITAFTASIVGGILQTVFQSPLDLISIRLYNQSMLHNEQRK